MTTSIGGVSPYLSPTTQSIDPALLSALLYLIQTGAVSSTTQSGGGGGGGGIPTSNSPTGPTTEDILLNYALALAKSGVGGVANQLVNTGDLNVGNIGASVLGTAIGALPMFLGPEGKYLSPLSSGLGSATTSAITGIGDPLTAGIGSAANAVLGLLLNELGAPSSFTSGLSTMQLPSMLVNGITNAAGLGTLLPTLSGVLAPISALAGPLVMTGLNVYEDYLEDKAKHEYQKDAQASAMMNYKMNQDAYDYFYDQALGDYLATGGIPMDEYRAQNGLVQTWDSMLYPTPTMGPSQGYIFPGTPYGQPGMVYPVSDPVLAYMLSPDITSFLYEPSVLSWAKGGQLGYSTSPAATMYYDPSVVATGIGQMLSGELTPEQIIAEWESYGLTPQEQQFALMMGNTWTGNMGPVNPQNMAKLNTKAGTEVDPFVYSYMMQKYDYDQKVAEKQKEKEQQEYYSSPEFVMAHSGAG